MKFLSIGTILKALGQDASLQNDRPITGGCIDSRLIEAGNVFIALAGEHTDGHLYVEEAFAGGAALALIERPNELHYPILDISEKIYEIPPVPFCLLVSDTLEALQQIATYWRRQVQIPVIGITGSVGKSSTKETLAALLSYKFKVLKNLGNQNNEIGLPLTLLSLNREHQVAVLEMGFYVTGEIDLLCTIARPQIGIITNIGTVHAERAGDLATIAQGKAELVQALPPEPNGLAVLNYDDHLVRAMASETSAKVVNIGLNKFADLWADEIHSDGTNGIRFTAHQEDQSYPLSSKLMGKHSVYNLLNCIAVALHLGMSWEEIDSSLKAQTPVQRVRLFKTASGAIILDDSYNASPLSTAAALDLLDELEGEKVAVLGDMLELGQYEVEGHQHVLDKALSLADKIILIGPRYQKLYQQATSRHFNPENIRWYANAQEASAYLSQSLAKDQIVLVKGSHGMNMVSIIKELEAKS